MQVLSSVDETLVLGLSVPKKVLEFICIGTAEKNDGRVRSSWLCDVASCFAIERGAELPFAGIIKDSITVNVEVLSKLFIWSGIVRIIIKPFANRP